MSKELFSNSNPNSSSNGNTEQVVPECVKKYGYIDKDPYSSSNFISRLLFYWAYRIVKLSNLTTIQPSYLGKWMGRYTSKNYLADIKTTWEDKKYRFKKFHPLIRAGIRANWLNILAVLFLCLIRSGITIVLMVLFREYMRLFREKTEKFRQVEIGILYLCLKFLEIFFNRKSYEYQSFWGYKSGVEFNCLIFDKLLKITPASMKARARSGEVINFMQIDSHKLTMLMLMSPDLITVPWLIISYSYMWFKFFGFSFIFGLWTLIVFLITNLMFQLKYKVFQREDLNLKDKRMKLLTEALNNIKVLKLYSWENEYWNRLLEAREIEINNFEKLFNIMNVNQSWSWWAPVVTSIVSLGMYQYFIDYIKIEDIFTCLGIFTSIEHPLRTLPMLLNNSFETTLSMKRIEKYLNEEEVKEKNVIKNNQETIEQGWSIKIENGDFTWDYPLTEKEKWEVGMESAGQQKKEVNSISSYVELKSSIENNTEEAKSFQGSSNSYNSLKECNESGQTNLLISSEKTVIETNCSLPRPTLRNLNLEIKKGEFVCIIGEVGCGKTSLLEVILNNMIPCSNTSKIYLNGSISYVSQSAWIQNETIKNNILFYKEYNEELYERILNLTELKPDWEVLVGGDLTEIGEKGINLSGGQKARISLARALYADQDIYIWDDPISAWDADVGMKIMNNCILKHLKNKTRILVTHALQYLSFADRILYMKEGEIAWQGSYNEIKDQQFFNIFSDKNQNADKSQEDNDQNKDTTNKKNENISKNDKITRITKDEDKEEGRVKGYVYKAYFIYLGGAGIISLYLFILSSVQGFKWASDIWWGYWSDNQCQESNFFYFFIYALLGLTGCLFNYFRVKLNSKCSIHLSRKLFNQMITSLIRAPISTFHETIPKGQIFNRFSKELNALDIFSMRMFGELMTCFTSFFAAIIICSIFQPYCLVFLPVLSILGYKIAVYYVKCSRDLSRLEGIIRSTLMNWLNETIPGRTTIRAYNYENRYMNMFHERVDATWNIHNWWNGTAQWFDLMLDWLSFSFIAFLIGFTIYFRDNFEPKVIGILITYSMSLQMNLAQGLHITTVFENSMVGLERCLKYTQCPTELPKKTSKDLKLVSWPSEGKIEFIDYSVKYRPDTPIILRNWNFEIHPREKIGIIGRTGSGKSTISLCLFRLLEPLTGKIKIDNVDITEIGLDKLRSSLTIIPQDPSLMEGTLRYNIDPLNQYNTSDITKILTKIGFDYILSQNEGGIDQVFSEGGSNISMGEKQWICITRAILRKSKIIIMDEATASIDYKTEEKIQKVINEILCDSTVVIIAHRIKTILHCDRIITLENGVVLDFDKPKALLDKKQGLFFEWYSKSTL